MDIASLRRAVAVVVLMVLGWQGVMAAPANGTAGAAERGDCGRASWKDVGWFLFRN